MPTPNYAVKQQSISEAENVEYVLSDGEPDRADLPALGLDHVAGAGAIIEH